MSSDHTPEEPTKFTEANALLAVQSGEPEVAQEKLDGMLNNELYDLQAAAHDLALMCTNELYRRARVKEAKGQ